MSDDDFLSRWSRRKRAVADEAAETKAAAAPEPVDEPKPETDEEETALLARLNLPVPESLGPGDDFSVFMQAGVPGFLRQRALRVLWKSNPVLANLDGLNDYDDDFTSPELTQKVLATAYKIGRGILSDPEDREILQDNGTNDTTDAGSVSESAPEPEAEPIIAERTRDVLPQVNPEVAEDEEKPFFPRRMRFES
jgi:hypothetical protein